MNGARAASSAPAAAPPQPLSPLRRLVWSVPLGWQLSALYTLLLAVTLTIVGTVVYSQQERFLVQDAAQRLQDAATRIVQRQDTPQVPYGRPGDRDGQPNRGGPGGLLGGQVGGSLPENLIRGLSGPDITVAILSTAGTVITSTQALDGDDPLTVVPVTAEQTAAVLHDQKAISWTATRSDGGRQVVVLMSFTWHQPGLGGAQGDTTLLLEQAASLAAADAALERLGSYLLLGVIFGTLAGVVLGLAFTRAVLRPLDHVASTAEAIAGGDLQRRLRLPEGRNEVARLGKTFDFMVGRLVSTLEAQRRFVADASHELRTPLTSLKGLAEILMIGAHGNDSRVIEQSAGAIHEELNRLSRLVNDLLTLSKLDSSGNNAPPTRRAPMDVCATLSAAADQLAPLAEARGLSLTKSCSGELRIIGDSGQVKQVLINLVDNALRYTPPGGEVTLTGSIEGTMAKIEVRDTGSGIEPRDLEHIFERFYRGDTSRTRATGNSGLGLAIVQAIVEAHQGTIGVTSTRGGGTTFTVKLPLATGRAAAPEEPARVPVGAKVE